MSATQELIAAALTAADTLDEISRNWAGCTRTWAESMYTQVEQLRESCARATVQPNIVMVKRLIVDFGNEAMRGNYTLAVSARTALLGAVESIAETREELKAERDALKHDNERLILENKALKYSLQLDEELIGKIQEVISVIANRPEVSK